MRVPNRDTIRLEFLTHVQGDAKVLRTMAEHDLCGSQSFLTTVPLPFVLAFLSTRQATARSSTHLESSNSSWVKPRRHIHDAALLCALPFVALVRLCSTYTPSLFC